MKELDLLKKDWKKNAASFVQVSENEIYKMIHKKSSSVVKWIFMISVIELGLGLAASVTLRPPPPSEAGPRLSGDLRIFSCRRARTERVLVPGRRVPRPNPAGRQPDRAAGRQPHGGG